MAAFFSSSDSFSLIFSTSDLREAMVKCCCSLGHARKKMSYYYCASLYGDYLSVIILDFSKDNCWYKLSYFSLKSWRCFNILSILSYSDNKFLFGRGRRKKRLWPDNPFLKKIYLGLTKTTFGSELGCNRELDLQKLGKQKIVCTLYPNYLILQVGFRYCSK